MPRTKAAAVTSDTRTTLLRAAAAEFNEHGYAGTDTNRIARRAGFAPQTFYRWYTDKLTVFIAAYQGWVETERELISSLLERNASNQQLAAAVVGHHREFLKFRRSLRQLSVEEKSVRVARAESRKRQIAQIRLWKQTEADESELAVSLLQMERLADALAEGEFKDMGVSSRAGENALARLIEQLKGKMNGVDR